MQRRHFLVATAIGSAAALTQADAQTPSPPESVQSAIRTFAALPVTTASCLVVCEPPGPAWQASYNPDAVLFVGSAVKTFILAESLRAIEKGEFTENEQWAVNDAIRAPSSPVLLNLSGTTPARSVLEAMIAHSDNTATDITLAKVGPNRVRDLIKEAGLTQTIIPNSIRRLYSYIAGAPVGQDLGWAHIVAMRTDTALPTTRSPVNTEISMLSTTTEMVHWYQQALTGQFFTKPESLTEFKRIQAMADAIPLIVPAGNRGLRQRRQHRLEQFPLLQRRRPDDRERHTRHLRLHHQLDRPGRRHPRNLQRLRRLAGRHPEGGDCLVARLGARNLGQATAGRNRKGSKARALPWTRSRRSLENPLRSWLDRFPSGDIVCLACAAGIGVLNAGGLAKINSRFSSSVISFQPGICFISFSLNPSTFPEPTPT